MGIEAQEAVKALKNRGLKVAGLSGPQGWRFNVTARSGGTYQISEAQLLKLRDERKLDWKSVVEIATKG